MPRHKWPVSSDYDPNTGIYVTQKLTCADVGNIRPPESVDNPSPKYNCPAGSEGTLNSSMARWRGDPYNADDQLNPGKPSAREISGNLARPKGSRSGLAEQFGTGSFSVERWFDMYTSFGAKPSRNCVTLDSIGKRFYQLNPLREPVKQKGSNPPVYVVPPGSGVQLRALMAACLCVDGGLKADPWYTEGGGLNRDQPFVHRVRRADIASCLRLLWGLYKMEEEDLFLPTKVSAGSAWIQMSIEPGDNGSGWDCVILFTLPASNQTSDGRVYWDDPRILQRG